jgi:histone RNA hairpin-binding protein
MMTLIKSIHFRDKRTRNHPKTPPRTIKYSRRAWEGLVKAWRKKLHTYDDNAEEENDA